MNKVIPKDKEFIFDSNVIISQTDLKGVVTYTNRAFMQVCGYDKDELIGKPHNIVRHPDMPKEIFQKMWQTIQSGQVWNGLLKNLRKDGLYYWVRTEVLPLKNDEGRITGYIAANKVPSRKDIQENEEIYQKMLEAENV